MNRFNTEVFITATNHQRLKYWLDWHCDRGDLGHKTATLAPLGVEMLKRLQPILVRPKLFFQHSIVPDRRAECESMRVTITDTAAGGFNISAEIVTCIPHDGSPLYNEYKLLLWPSGRRFQRNFQGPYQVATSLTSLCDCIHDLDLNHLQNVLRDMRGEP